MVIYILKRIIIKENLKFMLKIFFFGHAAMIFCFHFNISFCLSIGNEHSSFITQLASSLVSSKEIELVFFRYD